MLKFPEDFTVHTHASTASVADCLAIFPRLARQWWVYDPDAGVVAYRTLFAEESSWELWTIPSTMHYSATLRLPAPAPSRLLDRRCGSDRPISLEDVEVYDASDAAPASDAFVQQALNKAIEEIKGQPFYFQATGDTYVFALNDDSAEITLVVLKKTSEVVLYLPL
ncbi:MAG: hypothetical protein AAFV53_22530 [Myxococcota bacterium]